MGQSSSSETPSLVVCELCARRHAPGAGGRMIGFDDLPFRGFDLDPDVHFEAYGLPRPQSELFDPSLRDRMVDMSTEELARYADTIAVHNSNFESFGKDELAGSIERFDRSFFDMYAMNTVAVGNLAHLSMRSVSADVRTKAAGLLERLKKNTHNRTTITHQ